MPECSLCPETDPPKWVRVGPGAYCYPDCEREAKAAAKRSDDTQRFHEAMRATVAPIATHHLFVRPRCLFARLVAGLARMDYSKMSPMGFKARKKENNQ